MNTRKFILKTLSSLVSGGLLAGCLASWPAYAKELDTQPIAGDVDILRGILASALSEGKRRNDWLDREQIRSWYLARQGVVFRIDTDPWREQGGFMRHIEINQDFWEANWEAANEAMESAMESLEQSGMQVEMPELPEPPEPAEPAEPAVAYSFHTSDGASGSEADRQALRTLTETVRAKSRALRDKAKALRKLGRDDKNAAARAAIEKDIKTLKAELKAEREKQRALMAEQKAKAEAAWSKALAELEGKLVTTLCNYGGSLKSVPKEEHVTLILDDAVQGGEGRQDLYYVFSRKDLSDCQAERLSAAQLKDKALRYIY